MNPLRKVPLFAWFLVLTLIVMGVGVWFVSKNPNLTQEADTGKPVEVSNPVEGVADFEIVGRDHISQGTTGTGYISNPPTSGPHWPAPAKEGIYDSSLPDEQLIHNLEHGHIWISYKPDLSDDAKNKLKEIVQKDDWKVIMTPREANDSKIALAAWGRLLKMDDLDAAKVEEFIRTYRNRGPEKTPE